MSKTCKKLLASALAATMLFSTFVSSLVVSAAATGTLKIGTETITVGTESATVDFTLTFSEAVTAPQDLATIVAKNANEETLAIIGAELGEVTYVVDGEETKSPIIDGVVPDEDVEPPTVSVSGKNLDAGKILFESGVAGALDVKVINFTVTFDTSKAAVGTYTVTATTDATDHDEADVVVTTEDGAIVVEEPHTCTAGEATDNGNGTHDIACAGNCGKLFADNEACNYVEGICDVCGAEDPDYEPEIQVSFLDNGKALELKGVVYMIQYLSFDNVGNMSNEDIVKNGGVLYWKASEVPADYNDAVIGTESYAATLEDTGSTYNKLEEFISKSEGILSTKYAENVYYRPYIIVNGKYQYGDMLEYSVKTYCEGRFEKSKDEKLKKTLVWLLNYGAAAQTNFKIGTDDLANKDLESYVEKYNLDSSYLSLEWDDSYLTPAVEPATDMIQNFASTETITDDGKSLVLSGAISVRYYFGVGKDDSVLEGATEKTLYVWKAAKYDELANAGQIFTKENASYEVSVDEATYDKTYGYEYVVDSEGISSRELGSTLYAAFCYKDANGTEHCSGVITYSPETYASTKINDGKVADIDPLCKAMVMYGEFATDYFKSLG